MCSMVLKLAVFALRCSVLNILFLAAVQGANYKKILRLSYDVIITYDYRKLYDVIITYDYRKLLSHRKIILRFFCN